MEINLKGSTCHVNVSCFHENTGNFYTKHAQFAFISSAEFGQFAIELSLMLHIIGKVVVSTTFLKHSPIG